MIILPVTHLSLTQPACTNSGQSGVVISLLDIFECVHLSVAVVSVSKVFVQTSGLAWQNL